jgi:hypothetical protein
MARVAPLEPQANPVFVGVAVDDMKYKPGFLSLGALKSASALLELLVSGFL